MPIGYFMERLFVFSKQFDKKLKELTNWQDIQAQLEIVLLNDPETGDLIEGTHGLRKFRFAYGSKGKSGGLRILYLDVKSTRKIFFIALFSKNEKGNLSKEEVKIIGKEILKIKEDEETR